MQMTTGPVVGHDNGFARYHRRLGTTMTKRKDDHTPPPPGGRAAERLREFEASRGYGPTLPVEPAAEEESGTSPVPEPPSEEPPGPDGRKQCGARHPPAQ
jgi:hypothetical protein